MTFDLTTIVILLLGIWFFGATIKKILSGAGDMAGMEFQEMRADQVIRVMNQAVKRTNELDKIKDKPFLTAEEIIANYGKATERSSDNTVHTAEK